MNKTDTLMLLRQLVSDSIVRTITIHSDGGELHHTRYIDVDKFISSIDVELINNLENTT